MIKTLPCCCLLLLLLSCDYYGKKKYALDPVDKIKMLETDRAFAGMSEQKGIKQAYLEYIDSNGVLLRPSQIPLLGADAVDYLIQLNDSNYTLKWEPNGGAVAKSGEMGYTYGIYALKPSARDTILYGNYVNIWKKQADGKWKVVLNSENEGIDNQ